MKVLISKIPYESCIRSYEITLRIRDIETENTMRMRAINMYNAKSPSGFKVWEKVVPRRILHGIMHF